MSLHPNLHLLVPSSSPGISLEVRLYLPSTSLPSHILLSTSCDTTPQSTSTLTGDVTSAIRALDITRLVTAAHPWQKLGGNLLDPVIAKQLVGAIYSSEQPRTALVSFNARGVGCSQGSMGIFGLSTVNGEKDFTTIERWALELLGKVKDVRRVGYSWGSMSAINASPPRSTSPPPRSTLLISPPVTFFRITTLFFSSRTFSSALQAISKRVQGGEESLWLIHGTEDQFTSVETYKAVQGVVRREVIGAEHFFRDAESGRRLEEAIREWLTT